MATPTLTLTYPDMKSGKVRLLAATSDKTTLSVFKQAVIDEATQNLLSCNDSVLEIEYGAELRKLKTLLDTLIPDTLEAQGDNQ